jgi:hypothetical protein
MSEKMVAYLASMNCTETQCSIYVNPDDMDEFECTQWGGSAGWVRIGSSDSLSFGFVPTDEVLESYLIGLDSIEYKGKKVLFDRKALIAAYSEGRLDEEFQEWLLQEIEETRQEISLSEAEIFVSDRLPEIIAQYKEDLELAQ